MNKEKYVHWKSDEPEEKLRDFITYFPFVSGIKITGTLDSVKRNLISDWIKTNPFLKFIWFATNEGDESYSWLSPLLTSREALVRVQIEYSNASTAFPIEMDHFLSQIHTCPNLVQLHLKGYRFDEYAIAAYLEKANLLCLELSVGCRFQNAFIVIFEALKRRNYLREISFPIHYLQGYDGQAFCSWISSFVCSLKCLILTGSYVHKYAVVRLARSLRTNSRLRYLKIESCISAKRKVFLELQHNYSLCKLNWYRRALDGQRPLDDRNRIAYRLCRSSSLCVAWAGRYHFLGRDVMRLIAKELWETRGTIFWVKDNQIIPAPVKEKIVKKRRTEEDIDPDWVE